MPRCKRCGAKWRINYPFGKKGGARVTMLIEHTEKCKFRNNNSSYTVG